MRCNARYYLWMLCALPLGGFCDPAVTESARHAPAEIVTDAHQIISQTLLDIASRIDGFFGDEDVADDINYTWIKTRLFLAADAKGKARFDSRINLKLDLSKTRHRVKFLFESDAEETEDAISPPRQNAIFNEIKQDNYYAAIRNIIKDTFLFDLYTDAGIKLRQPIDPFARLRLMRRDKMGNFFLATRQTFAYFRSLQWSSDTSLEIDRILAPAWLLRFETSVNWNRRADSIVSSQHMILFQNLGADAGVSYTTGISGTNHPVRASHYGLTARYRYRVHSNWLYFETGPEVLFARDHAFEPQYLWWVGFETIFGKTREKSPQ